jgi:cysteine synthase A
LTGPKVHNDITRTIGGTPIVSLRSVTEGIEGTILAKLEFFNPLSSVKDRIGLAMIEAAERDGTLAPGGLIVEATSGNTGIALAFIAAAKGYRLILTMPSAMSSERVLLLRALGADVRFSPDSWGMKAAVDLARQIASEETDALLMEQFSNPANPDVHRRTTALEVWEATGGEVDMVVTGVGTGGTITGVAEVIKAKKPSFLALAVEPSECPVIAGGSISAHGIQGIGAGFIPDNLNRDILDGVVHVSTEEAIQMARRLALEEGIFAGISSGANVAAALKVARRPEFLGKVILTFCCSSGERYLSTELFRPQDG